MPRRRVGQPRHDPGLAGAAPTGLPKRFRPATKEAKPPQTMKTKKRGQKKAPAIGDLEKLVDTKMKRGSLPTVSEGKILEAVLNEGKALFKLGAGHAHGVGHAIAPTEKGPTFNRMLSGMPPTPKRTPKERAQALVDKPMKKKKERRQAINQVTQTAIDRRTGRTNPMRRQPR